MAEISAYFEKIAADRAMLLDTEESLRGNATPSLETCEDLAASDELSYIEEHFADFLRMLRHLRPDDQTLVLGYYAFAKTQTQLSPLFHTTQTLTSPRIRLCMRQAPRNSLRLRAPRPGTHVGSVVEPDRHALR